MADMLQAVAQYGPMLALKPDAQLDQLAEWIAPRAGLDKSEVVAVFQNTCEAILHFSREGQPVVLPGVGTFTPTISRIGEFDIDFRLDLEFKNSLNAAGAYHGEILNKEAIGWTDEQLKMAWDKDHAEDPLEV